MDPFALLAPSALWLATLLGSADAQRAGVPPIDSTPPAVSFPAWRRVESLAGPTEYRASFPSPLTTGVPNNDTVHLSAFLPEALPGPYPAVVVLHYLGADDLRPTRLLAEELNSRGVAAVLLTLPYHIQRTPPGAKSGELALSDDPDRIRAVVAQSVLDVRRTLDFLASRPEIDRDRLGVAGISLGGVIASLAYSVDRRLARTAIVLGGADLAHILWHSSLTGPTREAMRRRGWNLASLRERLADVEPLERVAARTDGRAFLVGARFDTVIPAEDVRKLEEAIPNAASLWLDTGHYGGVFVQRRVARTVAEFFSQEFSGRRFSPPSRLYAPTVRVGMLADSLDGFQVAASLDLLRDDRSSGWFGAAMATPGGPKGFLGRRLSESFSLGLTLGSGGPAAAALWSIVL
ncbi:MAG: alpha/beta hydrolase family protein [Fimbriimonadales bacterium]|nr:alpha/beta hydrolase family protein [Fimbriimonadales bacterium]